MHEHMPRCMHISHMLCCLNTYGVLLAHMLCCMQTKVACSAFLRSWVMDQARDPSSVVHGLLDEGSRVGAMGHSRGAKLAALLLAGGAADMF